MKPPIWFSLILASQELSCLLFFIVIFLCKIYQSQNIVRCHSTGLVQSKLGTFSPDRRLSRPNPDPQGLPCLTRVLPTCPTLFHSPGIQSLDGDHLYEPVIPCDKVLWRKTEKVRNYSLKFDFFTFFPHNFARPRFCPTPAKSIARTFSVHLVFDRILRSEPRFEFRRQFRLYVSTWKTDP
jgi:hypothetical protein